MTIRIGRRELITAFASTVVEWPLAARGQERERLRRVGVLIGGFAADDPEAKAQQAAFLDGLQQLGWIEGRNMRTETRWGETKSAAYLRTSAALPRSEESRVRLEEAKDRFDTLHRNLFRELDEQKALVDEKNNMLESLSSKLSKYLAPQIYQSIFPVVRMSRSKPSVKSSPSSSVISRISHRLPRIYRRRILRAS